MVGRRNGNGEEKTTAMAVRSAGLLRASFAEAGSVGGQDVTPREEEKEATAKKPSAARHFAQSCVLPRCGLWCVVGDHHFRRFPVTGSDRGRPGTCCKSERQLDAVCCFACGAVST